MAGGFAGIASMFGSISAGLSGFAGKFSKIGDVAKKMWADLKTWVNEKFIQPVNDALDAMGSWWEGFKDTVGEAWDSIMTYVGEKLSAIWDMLPTIPELFTIDFWTGLFTSIGTTVAGALSGLWDSLPALPDFLTLTYWTDLFGFNIDWDSLFSVSLPDFLTLSYWTDLFDFDIDWDSLFSFSIPDFLTLDYWTGLATDIGTALGGIGESIVGGLKASVNIMIGLINDLFASISFSKTIDLPGLDPVTFGFDLASWNIPMLAKGGIVNSPTLAMIGEAGPEAVVPLSGNNAGIGGTYNITVNAGGITDRTDKRALAREIGNMIQQELSRNMGGSTMRGR